MGRCSEHRNSYLHAQLTSLAGLTGFTRWRLAPPRHLAYLLEPQLAPRCQGVTITHFPLLHRDMVAIFYGEFSVNTGEPGKSLRLLYASLRCIHLPIDQIGPISQYLSTL